MKVSKQNFILSLRAEQIVVQISPKIKEGGGLKNLNPLSDLDKFCSYLKHHNNRSLFLIYFQYRRGVQMYGKFIKWPHSLSFFFLMMLMREGATQSDATPLAQNSPLHREKMKEGKENFGFRSKSKEPFEGCRLRERRRRETSPILIGINDLV